ncbi:hypothetical protein GCM10023149_48550 [Mucilaginibacter gynuensis]|uniref:HEPN domain-containing protein n=1 Tax=Mucilaginibacter gynuensis TaxID=1302236 RepID=A0ABP8HF68_9SPHI
MNQYLNQASHNKNFLNCVEANFDDRFFDWKITITFYIAIHLLKALAKERKKNIGDTHHEIANSLDASRCAKPVMQFPPNIWKAYKRLFDYSKSSRYDGIVDHNIQELAKQADYKQVTLLFTSFKSYMDSQKITIS